MTGMASYQPIPARVSNDGDEKMGPFLYRWLMRTIEMNRGDGIVVTKYPQFRLYS